MIFFEFFSLELKFLALEIFFGTEFKAVGHLMQNRALERINVGR